MAHIGTRELLVLGLAIAAILVILILSLLRR